jgi:PhoH-like ATPase
MKKTFVLDTNILLVNPHSIFQFEDTADVVIPITVLEEIDTFKKVQNELGRNARETSRILDKLRLKGSLATGVPISEDKTGIIYVSLAIHSLPDGLSDTADNLILSCAFSLLGTEVVLVTNDSNLRIKADAFGIKSQGLEITSVDCSRLYTGVRELSGSASAALIQKKTSDLSSEHFFPNEFISLEENSQRFSFTTSDGHLTNLDAFWDKEIWGLKPRNQEQVFALSALLDDKIKLVTLSGTAGTGKTLLAIAAGLSLVTDTEAYQKLLIARPILPLGKDIGYLPGDLNEKLNPWMQPIYDNLELILTGNRNKKSRRGQQASNSYQELLTQNIIQVEPLTYIRGRSLPNMFFVIDEAQNLTPHEIKTILTRAGEGTKIVLTGDPYQIDNPYIDAESNGLTYVIEKFKDESIAAHVTLTKGERSELATLASHKL